MSFNRLVKDEGILNGFASIHQAMSDGFDRMDRRIGVLENEGGIQPGAGRRRRTDSMYEHNSA